MHVRSIAAAIAFVGLLLAVWSCNQIAGVDFGGVSARQDEAGTFPIDERSCGRSCADLGFECGVQQDACGEAIDCGTCAAGRRCESGKCACSPKTCPELGAQCGIVDDGCGRALDCGGCANPNHVCASGTCRCQPKTCEGLGAECGSVPNECGDVLDCGAGTTCPPEKQYCGGGGPNKCGTTPCVPKTCAAEGKNCGQISDGCGSVLECAPGCVAPDSCGGGGVANVCGCQPKTCAQLGKSCGSVGDGCGRTIDCGACTAPQTCGGGGTANVCGCTASGSCPNGANCGTAPDGCGGNVACGPACAAPSTCGGGGVANTCGCTPNGTCSSCCGAGTDNCGNACRTDTCCGSTSTSGGGGGCFAAGTRITMADGGTKPIEDVIPGDRVRAFDPQSGRTESAMVMAALRHGVETSSDGFVIVGGRLRVTPNHPMFVDGHIVPAGSLRDVTRSPGGEPTYDLRIDGSGLYFAEGIVVANKPINE